MNYAKILSVRPIGERDTIDLEVDSADHNFFCDDICVSNSHSCAYASLASKTILLKFKYPQEFFCSILELAEFEQEPLQVIGEVEREIRNFGIELLPPQLDKSRMDFSIEGKDIRYGLKSIKGVSEQTKDALKIFAKNKTDNKYDVFILAKELKINIGVLSSLIYAGTLGRDKRLKIALEAQAFNLLTDREKRNFCLIGPEYSYNLLESILEVKESGRLADDGRPIMKKSRFDTFYKKFLPYKTLYNENKKYELLSTWWFEKKLLGYSYSNKLSDCFDKNGSVSLNQIDSGGNWRIVAFVEDVFIGTSRRGNKYMSLTVSDETSQRRITLSDSPRENKLTNFLENNKIKKEDIIIAHGNANFIDHLEIVPIKVYSKVRELT